MIVTKGVHEVTGYIEYRYDYNAIDYARLGICESDQETMFESDTFSSLEELLEKLKPEVLEKIKEEYDAETVWVSCISFVGKSEEGETTADITLYENKRVRGHVATKIKNEDIESRMFLNIQKIKEIVDNTIEQYPIKY